MYQSNDIPEWPTKTDLSEGDSNQSFFRRSWRSCQLDAETRQWLAEDEQYFLHQSLSTPCLNVLKSCKGSTVTDIQGRRYLDFHGNNVHQVGFGNERVIAAIVEQMQTLSFCTRRYTNIPAISLAHKLASLAPGNLNKVLFAPGGTTAVGMAMKLARMATGRFKTISMWDAFHGASLDAISISGESQFRSHIGPLLPGTEHVPPADPYHCLWDPQGRCETCGLKCARYVAYVMEKEKDISAVIAEPIRCTTVNPPPAGYWKAIRKACDRFGALLIFDETAIGLGRTGRMFASDLYDIEPDILILGKGLGGGIFPLAAMIAREDLDVAADATLGHYTHEKNPVACAAGLATIDFIETEGLIAHAAELGRYVMERLHTLMIAHPIVGNVRGQGLLFGMELVRNRKTGMPAVMEADHVMYECLKRGLNFKVSKGNFLTLTPPLTVTRSELDRAMDILDAALTEVENEAKKDYAICMKGDEHE